MEKTIAERVTAVIVDKLNVTLEEVVPTANFINDLGADSLDRVEMIMELEKELGVSIPDEDAEKLTTVGEAIAYFEEHTKK